MKRILLIILLTCFIQTSKADEWTTRDTFRQAGVIGAIALDWKQTRTIAENPQMFHEENVDYIIGRHPSTKSVDVYMLSLMILHTSAAYFLFESETDRSIFQYSSMFVELNTVAKNYSIGLKVGF